MNKHSEYNADRLETTRQSADRVRRLAWSFNAGAVLLAILLAGALFDYCWSLPIPGRWVSFGTMGMIIAGGIFRLIWLWRHPLNLKQAALSMEAQRPELGCVVSTAAEYLSGERKASHEYEPELVAALQEQAARRLLLVELPYYRKLLRTGAVMSLMLVAILLFVLIAPGSLTALAHAASPWSQSTYTSVTVKPGNGELPVGRDLKVQALFTGRPPKDPLLRWKSLADSKWQTLSLTHTTNGDDIGLIKNVREAIRYQVTGGDAVSPEFSMTTYVPPEVKDLAIGVQLPAYTQQPPTVEHEPNLSVLRASRLTFRVTSSCPLAKAQLRIANQPALALTQDSTNAWSGTLLVTNEIYYWVEIADALGHKGGNEEPYHIKVLPDEPPKVEIVSPGMDIRADATNSVPLKISVADDYGVGAVKLIFRKVGGPEQSVVCPLPTGIQKSVDLTNSIDLAPLNLKEYELVAYYAEALDNNTLDGPGVGKSPVYFIEYTTKGEPLSQCNGGGQKINLLQIEKQIIAATSAVDDQKMAEKFPEIATIQRQAISYAEIFRDSFVLSISPPEARTEFAAAIDSMNTAATTLDALQRPGALAAEDSALEHLYQVTRLLPELEKCMCHGNCTKIVLEAIEKLKESQKKEREQEIPKLLAKTKALAAQQVALNNIYRLSQNESKGIQPKPGEGKTNAPASGPKPGVTKPGESLLAKSGSGSSSSQENSEIAEHEVQPNSDAQPNEQANAKSDGRGEDLDQKQLELSKAADALAEKLRELSGKDPRVSSSLAQTLRQASQSMEMAARASRTQSVFAAQNRGYGLSGLTKVIRALELLLAEDTKPTDIATEEYPKEYEALISEYLRSLSYAQ